MARPGTDSPFDETQMKVGRRLAMKVLNAAKFVLGMPGQEPGVDVGRTVIKPADLAMLAGLRTVVGVATEAFEAYEYTDALEAAERFFWSFCDDYLELVKERAYGPSDDPRARSARAALAVALDVQLRLFAPFLPFATEEVWSWTHDDSIHLASWPTADEIPATGDAGLLADIAQALIAIRGAKSQAKASMKTEATLAEVSGPSDQLERLRTVERDLRAVGKISGEMTWTPTDEPLTVRLELASTEAPSA
jgi:valyl-tRNA synthetase